MTRHQQQVLVVSELHSIYSNIQRILTIQGLHSTHVQTVDKASIAIEESPFHIIILDGRLPQSTDFYQHLRHNLNLPVLVLTENNSATNGVASVVNEDDCLNLSFEATELIDAVRTVRQRCNGAKDKRTSLIHLGSVTIDLDRFEAIRNGEVIRLTRTEWALLEQLASHANTTLTHQVLLQRVWGDAYVDEYSYLHTYVRRLRRKLEPDPKKPHYLVTDVGIGYRMVSQNGFVDSHDSSVSTSYPVDTTVRANQLTAPPTSFLGRERELSKLQRLLEKPDRRLLTLTGPPGVGKTRLALHLVEHLGNHFTDGAHVISLAPLQDSALVVSAIAQALEIKEVAQQPIEDTLRKALQKQELLLLLDNFEHVLDAAPALIELITAIPRLTILVTSRTSLRVAGEQEYLVTPLEMPDATTIITKEIVEANPATQLFVQRSQSVKADFALTEENAAAIAAICARLDGLPLAIELAAARSKLFTPQALLARLDERLDILTRGLRGAPERHQTLRAALEWSYNLLSPEEQQLLMGLSVFVGGCTLEAATAVLNSDQVLVTPLALTEQTIPSESEPIDLRPSISFLNKVASLVDHSLIQVQTDSNGDSRFVLLETIREYALEKLQESGKLEIVQRRYTIYYFLFTKKAYHELKKPEQNYWLDRLDIENDNIRSSLQWIINGQKHKIALRIVGNLWLFWLIRGYLNEGREWIKKSLAKKNSFKYIRAIALNAGGILADAQSDYESAQKSYQEGLEIMHGINHVSGISRLLSNLGVVYLYQNEYTQAIHCFEESLRMFKKSKDNHGIGNIMNNLGLTLQMQGNYTKSYQYFQECLKIRQEMNDMFGIATTTGNIGRVEMLMRDYMQATKTLEESLEQHHTLLNKMGIIDTMNSLGLSYMYQNKISQARAHIEQALTLSNQLSQLKAIATTTHSLGLIEIQQNNHDKAIRLAVESILVRQRLQDSYGIAESLELLASANLIYKKWQVSLSLCSFATKLRGKLGAPISPPNQPLYDHTLSTIYTYLDEATWQQAWERGQKMSHEEAIDYALEHVLVDERVVGERRH